jgi:hypothetical protein
LWLGEITRPDQRFDQIVNVESVQLDCLSHHQAAWLTAEPLSNVSQ